VGGDPRLIGLGAAAFLLVALAGFTFWQTGARLEEATAGVRQARADSARMAATISLMESLRARKDTIERKIAVIQSVDGRRYVWPHLLDEISRAVPQYTWLSKVAAEEEAVPTPAARRAAAQKDTSSKARGKGKGKGKAAADSAAAAPPPPPPGPKFSIEGSAGTTQALTRFMKNLEASPMIQNVALVTSEQQAVEGRTFLRFTLEARWEQPDSAFVETVPVVTAP
jgi:Tfp pilus assembly protein PilN